MQIVTIGNCQARRIGEYLKELIPNIQVQYLSPTSRVHPLMSADEAEKAIKNSDIIIRQPLSDQHGILSSAGTKSIAKNRTIIINFAYFFNHGIASFCSAPAVPIIYGEEIINKMLSSGIEKSEILKMWSKCQINFDIINRFEKCFNQFKERENNCDIKISNIIKNNYKKIKIFDTHNHPSLFIFRYYLIELIKLQIFPQNLNIDIMTPTNLPKPPCPITPRDKEEHGYEFNFDPNWGQKGHKIICKIYENFQINHINSNKI